ncbi:transcription antitermination factor NusB [Actinoallomurus purpureus]|uniref:transcription antitermination factor NusB n=1 Tax=Actinoallomurus purpureus TaxID=478114 RepID=UPI002093F13D|nr:transcription antitermination factor NusB [Actinoallomurus purpureus]MCO6005825.1 transcription antitermination factor NusB [Actinoallomurus purpureus]
MAARSKARRRALEILYEAEVRGDSPIEVLDRRTRDSEQRLAEQDFVERLVEGVASRRERIDELIATYAVGWTLDRMPMVDRNILRLGAFELLWSDDVPDGVAVSEAVALATELSTDESPRFVNGLLSRLLELKPSLSL